MGTSQSSHRDSIFVHLEQESSPGVVLEVKRDVITIKEILPNGWAFKTNSLRVGDEILAIECRSGKHQKNNVHELLNDGGCFGVTIRRTRSHHHDVKKKSLARKFSVRSKKNDLDSDFQFSYHHIVETGSASPLTKPSDVESILNQAPSQPEIFGVHRNQLLSFKDFENAINRFTVKEKKIVGVQYNNLACFCSRKFRTKSLDWFEAGLEHLKKLPQNSRETWKLTSICLKNYAFLLMDEGKFPLARQSLFLSLELDCKLNDFLEVAICLENLAVLLWTINQYDFAEECGKQAYINYRLVQGVDGIDTQRMKALWVS